MMQSGIGPADELQRHGIPVVQHLPGVGQNHQDHVSFGCIFEYRTPQPIGHGGSEATLYWKSEAGLARPDMFHCQVEFPVPSAETAALGCPSMDGRCLRALPIQRAAGYCCFPALM
ncbi:Oxygen-dependent choline dehydrogenase [Sodalis praecaptivus]|nr:Oxygen-dependent choline dehydrogenase [Sodalis praecaptivus]